MTKEVKCPPVEEALRFSISEAEKFENVNVLVKIKAENKLARWLMTDRRYKEAVPLFTQVAQFQYLTIQELKSNFSTTQEIQIAEVDLAQTFHMLSSCSSHLDDSESLQEGIKFAENAIQLYGDSKEYTQSKKSAIALQIEILDNLAGQTKNEYYAKQKYEVYRQHSDLFQNKEDQAFRDLIEKSESTETV